MRYGQIRRYDIANGVGIRTTVFVTGCTHHCPGCFNLEYQDFNAGKPWTDEETALVVKYASDPNVAGLTLLGGEPMQNAAGLIPVVKAVKEATGKSVWVYSGDRYETIVSRPDMKALLVLCDVLVDGLFVEGKRDPMLRFRGSSNQRVIDIQKSLSEGEVVLARDEITGETF